MSMMNCKCNERQRLLTEISKVDFVLKDLNLYLDTHPYDQQAIDRFRQYNRMKKQLTKDYTKAYGPLELSILDDSMREWKCRYLELDPRTMAMGRRNLLNVEL